MLDEYLALGGVELGNNARALAYSRCLPCCVGLLKGGACDGIHDATSGFVNAVREWQVQAINLATNPQMESSNAEVEVRRNLAFGAPGAILATRVNDVAFDGSLWYEFTSTGSPGGMRSTIAGAALNSPYTATAEVANPGPTAITLGRVSWADQNLTSFTLQPGERKVITVSGTSATLRFFDIRTYEVGVVFLARLITVEAGIFAERVPFDGSGMLVPDPDFTALWLGTVGNSESSLRAPNVQGISFASAQGVAWQSTADGTTILRGLIAQGTGAWGLSGFATGLSSAESYTLVTRVRTTWTGFVRLRAGGSASTEVSVPVVAGEWVDARAFVAGANSAVGFVGRAGDGWVGGDVIEVEYMTIVAGEYNGGFFDGSTLPAGAGDDFRVSWSGAEDASTSILERNVVTSPSQSLEPAYACDEIQRAPWYDPDNEFSQSLAGFYLLRVSGITDSTATATVTQGIDDGGVIGASRHATRSVRVRSMIIGCGNGAAEYGLAWLKAALSDTFCARHGDACGTSDLSFFIDCPPRLDQGDDDYAATTARYRRYLHGVGMTSGPIIAEEYETTSGAYVIVVEYILTAESPFVWGETIPVASTGDVLTAFDDIPFNLMRHPNAEVGDGIPAVTATQYVFNGSVEYGATGWANSVTNIPAGITAGVSSDIAAVGPNSYRVRLLATGAVAGGVINAYYDVALGAMPAGSKPSLSLWAAALIFGGAPTLDPNLAASVEWRNGATVVGTTVLGDIPLNGGNATATGLTIPATATTARIRVRASNITAAAADDLRLYADAFSLTVP